LKVFLFLAGLSSLVLIAHFLHLPGQAPATALPTTLTSGIYLAGNGFHSAIILPLNAESQSHWTSFFEGSDLDSLPPEGYLEFGWGHLDYYTHSNPGPEIGLKALLWPFNQATLHIVWYPDRERIRRFGYSSSEIRFYPMGSVGLRLLDSVLKTWFLPGANARAFPIKKGLYGSKSAFFLARGLYSGGYTCNTWSAALARKLGIRVPGWPVFGKLF
jgi:uncharacterized protein (TIGR02117 family)